MATDCYICSGNSKIIMSFEDSDVFVCSQCKHIFSGNLRLSSDKIFTPEYIEEDHKNWFNNPDINLFKIIQSAILKSGNKQQSIIDIGCGNGNFLKFLQKENFVNLTGLDIINQNFENIEFICQDFNTFKTTKKYDVITSIANIEHLQDVNAYVAKLKELLSPNGIIIIMTVNESSLLYKLSKILYKFGIKFAAKRLYSAHHINHFSKKSLLKVIDKNSLKVINHFTKNIPMKSIDMDEGFFAGITFMIVIFINFLTIPFNNKFLQTIVIENK